LRPERRAFERNDNWFIVFYSHGKRVRGKVGPSKGEALRALSIRKSEIALGRFHLIPRASIPTFTALTEK
jgi:hypothetical protein